jgi:hypothetical protein
MLQTTLPTKIVHYHRIVNKGTQGESDKNKENSQGMHKIARTRWNEAEVSLTLARKMFRT